MDVLYLYHGSSLVLAFSSRSSFLTCVIQNVIVLIKIAVQLSSLLLDSCVSIQLPSLDETLGLIILASSLDDLLFE